MKIIIIALICAVALLAMKLGVTWRNAHGAPSELNTSAEKKVCICADSPNCVSSMETRSKWAIDPLAIPDDSRQAWLALEQVIADTPRATITLHQENRIHITFQSRFLGFIDDVDFLLDSEQGVIQMRSASRQGYSDFGVNRKRLESIRERYFAVLAQAKKDPPLTIP